MPAVSVILPFHQVTPFLAPAVRSILDQTWRDLELLVVDNGTGTGLTALGRGADDPRVRLISHPSNLGVAAAHNAARAAARGEFVANMDSDDIALPMRIERQIAELRADPRLELLATHADVIDDRGRRLRAQFTLPEERDQRIFSAYSLPITNPTLMGRRAVFERFPMRGEFSVSSDYDFFARAIESCSARALPEVLLQYRRHASQLTVSRQAAMVFNACLIRIVTARRRAGRPEKAEELLAGYSGWLARPPPPAECYARFAALALAEKLPLLAVFLARRSVSVQRTPGRLGAATRILGAALAQCPRDAIRLLRMYATGPVRAPGLRPLARR